MGGPRDAHGPIPVDLCTSTCRLSCISRPVPEQSWRPRGAEGGRGWTEGCAVTWTARVSVGTAPRVRRLQYQSGDRWHRLSPSSSEPATGRFPAGTPDARSSAPKACLGTAGGGRGRVSSQPGASLEEADKNLLCLPRPAAANFGTTVPTQDGAETWGGSARPPLSRPSLQGGPGLLLLGPPQSPVPGVHRGTETLRTGQPE